MSGPEGKAKHWPHVPRKLPSLCLRAFNLAFLSDLLHHAVGWMSRWKTATLQLHNPVPGTFLDGYPTNSSLFLIVLFSASLTPTSYFSSSHVGNPSTSRSNLLYPVKVAAFAVYFVWINMWKMEDGLDPFDILDLYIFMCCCCFCRTALQKVRGKCGFMFSLDPGWLWFAWLLLHLTLL